MRCVMLGTCWAAAGEGHEAVRWSGGGHLGLALEGHNSVEGIMVSTPRPRRGTRVGSVVRCCACEVLGGVVQWRAQGLAGCACPYNDEYDGRNVYSVAAVGPTRQAGCGAIPACW